MAERPLDDHSMATRRTVLTGALAVGVVPLLAACGSDDSEGSSAESTSTSPSESDTAAAPSKTSPEGDDDTAGGETQGEEGEVVAAKADVPVGGGIILGGQELVVTQPSAGQFRGFTSICTHQGCTVGDVTDGSINCPCHGSMFDIDTGAVLGGPAPSPLGEKPIIVAGQEILLADD